MSRSDTESPNSGAAMDRVVERRRLWPRRLVLVAIGAAAIAAAVWLLTAGRAPRTVEVAGEQLSTAEVKRGQFDDFIQVRGRVAPLKTIFIDTVQGGQVEAIHVEDGATVERGQLLVELSNTQLQLEVISREAQITEQLNNLRSLELSHEQNRLADRREAIEVEYQITRLDRLVTRSDGLVKTGAMPRGEYEQEIDELAYYKKRRRLQAEREKTTQRLARTQLSQLRTAAKQLTKNLEITRRNLDSLSVRAVADGQLTAFTLEVGQSLAAGERIGQIDDPERYKIVADIDEFYLGRVDVGQRATYDGRKLVVSKIRPQVSNGRFQIDLEFVGDAPSELRRGQTAQARLQLGQPTGAVLIPNAAFYNDTGGAWVFVVSPDRSRAVRRAVRLGRRNPEHIEVLEGLTPGEVIITSPYTSYLDMERLTLTP